MKPGALTWVSAALGLLLAVPAHAADTVYYYSSDTIHSEVVVTDQNRNVVERTDYAPYGQVLDRDLRDGPGYGGHEEDPETSLVYMQQRYYDPEAGRFLSTDPVQAGGGGGSFNRYEYADDNPYRYTDPDGRESGAGYATGEYTMALPPSSPEAREAALTMGVVGGVIIATATGADEAVGVGAALRAGARYVGAKIAGAVTRRVAARAAEGDAKSLKDQAADLVSQNGGKNRVTIESPSQKIEVDLAGKSHGGIETPHVKVSERNLNAPNQPAYNTKSAQVRPATQEDIDLVKNHLKKDGQ